LFSDIIQYCVLNNVFSFKHLVQYASANKPEWIQAFHNNNHLKLSIIEFQTYMNDSVFDTVVNRNMSKMADNTKQNELEKNGVADKDKYGYLDPLTPELKHLIVVLAENGEINLYHSCMAIIEEKLDYDKESLYKYYKSYLYSGKNHSSVVLAQYDDYSKELFELCWKRMMFKGRIK